MHNFNGFKNNFLTESNDFEFGCMMLDLNRENSTLIEEMMLNINPDHLHKQTNKIGKRHITVKYGFTEDNISNDVKIFVDNNKELFPLRVTYSSLSLFDNPEYDVLKMDIEDYEDLLTLNGRVENTFETFDTFQYYHPHVTIAYMKKGYGKLYINMLNNLKGSTEYFNGITYSEVSDEEHLIKPE